MTDAFVGGEGYQACLKGSMTCCYRLLHGAVVHSFVLGAVVYMLSLMM